MEAADAIRAAARAQGYDERNVLNVQAGFDWNSLQAEAGNLSLFASRRIIDLRLSSGKPGDAGAKALREYAKKPPEDTLLLITAGKLEPQARKSKWVQELERAGVVLFVWPLKPQEFTGWLQQRMQRRGLQPDRDALRMLAERVEGNLLAAVQEIDKLFLLCGAGKIGRHDIEQLVADLARFDVFGLVDAALAGEAARSVRMLQGLRAEGTAEPVVLWALAREIRTLCGMTAVLAGGRDVAAVLAQYRVWEARKGPLGAALRRLQPAQCRTMLRQCARLDRVCKGQAGGNAWDELLQLTLQLAGAGLPVADPALPALV
jgi:DNA polymerase-3 subunit delta